MVSSPLVSVCIPVFNGAPYIRQCIDSALAQSMGDFEVICVDDGSTDATDEILRSYGKCIRHYSFGRNLGLGFARNFLLAMARGDYIQPLDADNYLLSKKFEYQIPILQRDTGLAMVFGDQDYLHENTGEIQRLQPRTSTEGWDMFEYCLQHNLHGGRTSIDTNVSLFRRDWLERVNGWRPVQRSEDKDLTMRMAAAGARFQYEPGVHSVYRVHDGPRISGTPADSIEALHQLTCTLAHIIHSYDSSLSLEHAALAARVLIKKRRVFSDEGNIAGMEAANKALRQLGLDRNAKLALGRSWLRRIIGRNSA